MIDSASYVEKAVIYDRFPHVEKTVIEDRFRNRFLKSQRFPRDFLAAWEAENPGWKDTNPAARRRGLRMVGNAVCPPLIALLAGAVLDHIRIEENYRSEEVEEEVHFRFREVEGEGERKAKTSRVLVSFRKTRRGRSSPHREKTNWTRLGFHTAMRLAKKASLLGGQAECQENEDQNAAKYTAAAGTMEKEMEGGR